MSLDQIIENLQSLDRLELEELKMKIEDLLDKELE